MTWNAKMKEADAIVAEGEHRATLTNIRDVDGQHGATVRMDFILSADDEWDGREISGIASKRLSENTKLGRWVSAILGRIPEIGEEVTAETLIHKDCRVVVKHKTNADGKTFANVVEVLPVNETQV